MRTELYSCRDFEDFEVLELTVPLKSQNLSLKIQLFVDILSRAGSVSTRALTGSRLRAVSHKELCPNA